MLETLITALTGVVDRLIALVREGKSNKRELFENHLEPIFGMLEKVIDDYLTLFWELEREFLDTSIPPSRTIEKLINRRRKTAILREKINQYANALPNAFKDPDIEHFAGLSRSLLRKEPSYLRSMREAGAASTLTGMLGDLGEAVANYHNILMEIHGDGIEVYPDGIKREPGAAASLDGCAVVDSTPRELFALIVRANRKEVESIWSRVAATYYRLKVRLLR